MPHIAATVLMRLFTVSSEPILNKPLVISERFVSPDYLHRNIHQLDLNGTPVFWRFDTIHGVPFISTMLSAVRFLMSMKEIPVQQPKTKRSLANAMFGSSNFISVHGGKFVQGQEPRSLWSGSTWYMAKGFLGILPL